MKAGGNWGFPTDQNVPWLGVYGGVGGKGVEDGGQAQSAACSGLSVVFCGSEASMFCL